MTKVGLPEIPTTPMFIDNVMTMEWQEFFRDTFRRIGEHEALTNTELEQLALQSRDAAMMLDPFPDEGEPMVIPGLKGDKGDQGLMGPPGLDGEDIEHLVGLPLERNQINGDGLLNRVVRRSKLTIENGTNASTIKCTLASEWNGYAEAATDNISKGATTGNYTLSADGAELIIEKDAFDASAEINTVSVLAVDFYNNTSKTNILIQGKHYLNDIWLKITGLEVKNGGTSGAIATGGTIAHGLWSAPTKISVTAAESGPTDLYASFDATNITVTFGGGGNKTFQWTAEAALAGAAADLTSIVDDGNLYLDITFLTDR